jgi:hypothetical protein
MYNTGFFSYCQQIRGNVLQSYVDIESHYDLSCGTFRHAAIWLHQLYLYIENILCGILCLTIQRALFGEHRMRRIEHYHLADICHSLLKMIRSIDLR